MTDKILEQIKSLMVDYNAAKETETTSLMEREILYKQLVAIGQSIYSYKCDFVKISTSDMIDSDLLIAIAIDMKILKEKEKELNELYKKVGNKYSTAWPKSVKIRKKIHKFQDQYWRDMDLFILPFA